MLRAELASLKNITGQREIWVLGGDTCLGGNGIFIRNKREAGRVWGKQLTVPTVHSLIDFPF